MKRIIIGAGLISADQLLKLWIFRFFRNSNVVLIPQVLRFHPVQNKNLNWIASVADYKTTVIQMAVLQAAAVILALLAYRYLAYCSGGRWERLLSKLFILFFVAGICGSTLDVMLWGGSLDFIRLFNWFTFDVKDIYLSASVLFLILYSLAYLKRYYRLDSQQRKQLKNLQRIRQWIKAGFPVSQK